MSLARNRLTFCKVAYEGEFEHFALQSLDDEHDDDREKREADHHANQQEEEAPDRWKKKQREAQNPEQGHKYNGNQTDSEALKGMKAHEAVFAIGLDENKHDRREQAIRQGASQLLGQHAYHALGELDRTHGAAATRTKSGGIGHLCCAVWAGGRQVIEQPSPRTLSERSVTRQTGRALHLED
jgi:hypothetical protein